MFLVKAGRVVVYSFPGIVLLFTVVDEIHEGIRGDEMSHTVGNSDRNKENVHDKRKFGGVRRSTVVREFMEYQEMR